MHDVIHRKLLFHIENKLISTYEMEANDIIKKVFISLSLCSNPQALNKPLQRTPHKKNCEGTKPYLCK